MCKYAFSKIIFLTLFKNFLVIPAKPKVEISVVWHNTYMHVKYPDNFFQRLCSQDVFQQIFVISWGLVPKLLLKGTEIKWNLSQRFPCVNGFTYSCLKIVMSVFQTFLKITLDLSKNSQNMWRRVVVKVLIPYLPFKWLLLYIKVLL